MPRRAICGEGDALLLRWRHTPLVAAKSGGGIHWGEWMPPSDARLGGIGVRRTLEYMNSAVN